MIKRLQALALALTALLILTPACAATDMAAITLSESGALIDGTGARAEGDVVTISWPGRYSLSGEWNGQIVVDVQEEEKVTLVLNQVELSCDREAPLLILSSPKRTVLELVGENMIRDLRELDEEAEHNAALWSKNDLTLRGDGLLRIQAGCDEGISTKDDLEIEGISLIVESAGVGIRGKDSVLISCGVVTVNAGKDGIKSSRKEFVA